MAGLSPLTVMTNIYRPQRSSSKIMFLHLSVCSQRVCVAGYMATAVDGRHPTSMHSCLSLNSANSMRTFREIQISFVSVIIFTHLKFNNILKIFLKMHILF